MGLANGFIMSGQGIGIFLWSPLMEFLIETYGWTGALCIEGAVLLNLLVFIYIIFVANRVLQKANSSPIEMDMFSTHDNAEGDISNMENHEKKEAKLQLTKYKERYQESPLLYGSSELINYKHIFTETELQQQSPQLSRKRTGSSSISQDATDTRNSSSSSSCSSACHSLLSVLSPIRHVFRYPRFLLFCCAMMLCHVGHMAVFAVLPSRGVEVIVPGSSNMSPARQASFLISIIGIINLFGRLVTKIT